jgi:hypothetical protein
MAMPYRCRNRFRLAKVKETTDLQGIDYLEVAPGQRGVKVFLIGERPVPPLRRENIAILGGARVRGGTILPGADGGLALIPGDLRVETMLRTRCAWCGLRRT